MILNAPDTYRVQDVCGACANGGQFSGRDWIVDAIVVALTIAAPWPSLSYGVLGRAALEALPGPSAPVAASIRDHAARYGVCRDGQAAGIPRLWQRDAYFVVSGYQAPEEYWRPKE